MNHDLMFSSKTDEWETPQSFFQIVDKEFRFTIDVCATDENKKCSQYFSPDVDGLSKDWTGVVWCNPPYGRKMIQWVKKAYDETTFGRAETVVMLLPARTDTKWFHEYIYGKAEIRFIKGRIKFGNSRNSAPFPSMLVIYRNNFCNETEKLG